MLAKDDPSHRNPTNPLMVEKTRILIVDDDPNHIEMMREFLRLSGFTYVVSAPSIRSLIRRLQAEQFDIILLDYRLPDGNGLDALKQIKALGLLVPVIIVTAQGDERLAVQALQQGAIDYLLKSGDYLVTLPSLIRKSIEASQLQLSIQRSLEKIRYQALLLNNVRDAVVVWDMDGMITYWNPAAEHLYGWSAQEKVGLPVETAYMKLFNPPIRILGPEQTTGHYIERQYETRSGKIIWVSSRLAVLRDASAGNRLIGYLDVSHDITRNKQAEQALRESEARYRAIVEDYQTELICRFKPEGKFSFVNEVFCQYLGKGREQLLQDNLFDYLPKNDYEKMREHLAGFDVNRPVATIEHQINLPNGKNRWLQRTDRAIFDPAGQIIEFQTVGRDITDRKQMQAEIQVAQMHLIQAARLATLGELASGVAHQINNPLTTILADAQLLLREIEQEHPGRDSADAILEAGWRVQQVVQRLLEFSRPEVDTLDLLSVNETIEKAISLVGAQIISVGINLNINLQNDLPSIRGNARQLIDLWVNLLLLARDSVTNSKAHQIDVRSHLNGSNQVVVEVQDDGEPIPPDQRETIFEPNFIGPTSNRGTGLELSICREIVRQHLGVIIMDSSPQEDTIFRVLLPVESETPNPESVQNQSTAG